MRKQYTTQRQFKKIGALGLSVLILSGGLLQDIRAADNEVIKVTVSNATYLLEDAIQNSMDLAEDEVRKEIVKKKLDYRLTMDSFYAQDNPYLESDYLDLITAYIIAKKDSEVLDKGNLYSLPFVEMKLDENSLEEYEPLAIKVYSSRSDGYYEMTGEEYIYEPMEIPVYEKVNKQQYRLTETTKKIKPEKKEVKYGEISLCGLSYRDILNYYDVGSEAFIEEFKELKEKLNQIVSGKGLAESVFIETIQNNLVTTEISDYLRSLNDIGLSFERKMLIRKAVTLIGRVPYEWGGKATNGGYDNTWWTIESNGKQKGLDCSGFVQWCFMDSIWTNLDQINNMISTQTMLRSMKTISQSSLQPGDLGFLHSGNSETTNHVGIYLGNDYWIHCSSGAKTVTVEQTDMFKVFRKMPDSENDSLTATEQETTSVYTTTSATSEYTDQDIYLLAQLVYNEANTEGLNGWIAVAEVVKNRLNSPLFPDTIREVIYQKDPVQFSNYQMIEKREPREEQISVVRQVLEGTLGVLNNEDVLFFRNAKGSEEDWTGYEFYTSINHHQFYTRQ